MRYIQCIIAFFMILSFTASAQAIEVYQFDPAHSFITWHVSHFGFSQVTGKFFVTGTIVLDDKNQQNAKVNAEIDTNSLSTGIPKLDERLKSSDFFDVTRYPKATFVSHKVVLTGKERAQVYGVLTIHGVSKRAILSMKLVSRGEHPFFKKKAVSFSGTTSLDRSSFGITKYLPGVGDRVHIDIESEAMLRSVY